MRNNNWLMLIGTAFLLIVSYPPLSAGFCALFAFLPFFFFLREKSLKESFAGGYFVGFLWALGTIYWLGSATLMGLVGALIYLPLFWAVYALLQRFLMIRGGLSGLMAAPILWTASEIVFSKGEMGFPWLSLALTQTWMPLSIQYISITGMYGISFWVMAVNCTVYLLIQPHRSKIGRIRLASALVALIILPILYGVLTYQKPRKESPSLKISLVQGNIDPFVRWTPAFIDSNFIVYDELTRQVSNLDPDLIVWPESAVPTYLKRRYASKRRVRQMVQDYNCPILTGAPDFIWKSKEDVSIFNSALFIKPFSRTIDTYYKVNLVPFSERVPYIDQFPPLYKFAQGLDLDIGNYVPGDSLVLFEFPGNRQDFTFRFAPLICYDSVFPTFVSAMVRQGAHFLVIITNDGWFANTSGPYQHLNIALLRAIENRIYVARCASTGISAFIDPFGRILAKTRQNVKTTLTHTIPVREKFSFYTQYAQWLEILFCLFSLIILSLIILIPNKRRVK